MNIDPRKNNQHLASPDISARVVERSRISDHLRNPHARIPLLLKEKWFAPVTVEIPPARRRPGRADAGCPGNAEIERRKRCVHRLWPGAECTRSDGSSDLTITQSQAALAIPNLHQNMRHPSKISFFVSERTSENAETAEAKNFQRQPRKRD